jgi:hypothetical protein
MEQQHRLSEITTGLALMLRVERSASSSLETNTTGLRRAQRPGQRGVARCGRRRRPELKFRGRPIEARHGGFPCRSGNARDGESQPTC